MHTVYTGTVSAIEAISRHLLDVIRNLILRNCTLPGELYRCCRQRETKIKRAVRWGERQKVGQLKSKRHLNKCCTIPPSSIIIYLVFGLWLEIIFTCNTSIITQSRCIRKTLTEHEIGVGGGGVNGYCFLGRKSGGGRQWDMKEKIFVFLNRGRKNWGHKTRQKTQTSKGNLKNDELIQC